MHCIHTLRPAAALALVSGLLLSASAVDAASFVLLATDSGWYDDDGTHSQVNENYVVGWRAFEHRNFFVFDLSEIPLGETVVSATLRLWNPILDPPTVTGDGYQSPDPFESYELVEVSTPVPLLTLGGFGLVTTYDDLGDGPVYGGRDIGPADNGTNVDTVLNATAIAAINSTVGMFAIGGRLTTIAAGEPVELAFGNTNDESLRALVVETVPEPGTAALIALGLVGLARARPTSL